MNGSSVARRLVAVVLIAGMLVPTVGMPLVSQPAHGLGVECSGNIENVQMWSNPVTQPLAVGSYAYDNCKFTLGEFSDDGLTTAETQNRLYTEAVSLEDSREQFTSNAQQRYNATYSRALSEAKLAALKERASGGTEAEVKSAVAQKMNEFWSRQQAQAIEHQNRQMQRVVTMLQTANESGVTGNMWLAHQRFGDYGEGWYDYAYGTDEITLYNGDTLNATVVWYAYSQPSGGGTQSNLADYGPDVSASVSVNSSVQNVSRTVSEGGGDDGLIIRDSDTYTGESAQVARAGDYGDVFRAISDKRQQSIETGNEIATAVTQNYQPDELDDGAWKDLVSPEEKVREYSTKYGETGNYLYLMLLAQENGWAIPQDVTTMSADYYPSTKVADSTTSYTVGNDELSGIADTHDQVRVDVQSLGENATGVEVVVSQDGKIIGSSSATEAGDVVVDYDGTGFSDVDTDGDGIKDQYYTVEVYPLVDGAQDRANASVSVDEIVVRGEKQELSGGMYADDGVFENDTIYKGQLYHTQDLGGQVTFLNQKAESTEDVVLSGDFVLTKMTDGDGNSYNKTTIQGTDFASGDTSDINNQTKTIIQTRGDIEDDAPEGPDGPPQPPSGGNGLLGVGLIIGGLIALGLAVKIAKTALKVYIPFL